MASRWLSPHHHQQQISPLHHSPEREKVISFISLSFHFSRFLDCLELFADFSSSIYGLRLCGPASQPKYYKNHLTCVDSSLVVPLVLGFYRVFLSTAQTVQPDYHENHPDLSGLYPDSPLWILINFPLSSPLIFHY